MMCRQWRGWTTARNADAYEHLVRTQVIPGIEARAIQGFRHIDLLRRTLPDGSAEFTTLMWFDSLDAVTAFAGEDREAAYVPVAAQAILAHYDLRAAHHDVVERRPQTGREEARCFR